MDDFEQLYRTYYPQVYRYLLRLCTDEAIAEELTQDTFFKVFRHLKDYRGDCQFYVWVCQIAKNNYYSYLKKHKRLDSQPIDEMELATEQNIELDLINKDMAMKVHEILHHIEEPYREVFWMRTFGELSFAEIARVHGKTESWARVTYHRAKLKIQEELT